MPRIARIVLSNVPMHIIQRGNTHQACFFRTMDYQRYLHWLREHTVETGCQVHTFVLMTNHLHLVITPGTIEGPGKLMKLIGQRYT